MRVRRVGGILILAMTVLTSCCQPVPRGPTDPTLTSASDIGSWRTFGYDLGNTRFSPETAPPPEGKLSWQRVVAGVIWAPILVADGMVYAIGSEAQVVALDAETGSEVWQTQLRPSDTTSKSLNMAGDILYAMSGTDAPILYALDRFTGRVLWQREVTVGFAPIAYGGVLYGVGGSGKKGGGLVIELRDAVTGDLLDTFPWGAETVRLLLIGNGILYAGSGKGGVYAFNLEDGELMWTAQMEKPFLPAMMLVENKLYVSVAWGDIVVLDAGTGQEVDRFENPDAGSLGNGATAYGMIFITYGDSSGNPILGALDVETGKPRWQFKVEGTYHCAPSVANGVVYYAVDTPPESQDALYGDGKMYALDAYTGELIWEMGTPRFAWASPSIVDGVLYVGTSTGEVVAIR